MYFKVRVLFIIFVVYPLSLLYKLAFAMADIGPFCIAMVEHSHIIPYVLQWLNIATL